MTGHGDAHCEEDGLRVSVDIRTVNSRYFKMSFRGGELWGDMESKVESLVRKQVRRGTVNLQLQIVRGAAADYRINQDVLASYLEQLSRLDNKFTRSGSVSLDTLLALPGVVDTESAADSSGQTWQAIQQTVEQAIDKLQTMRQSEGQAMAADLNKNLELVLGELDLIEARAPEVIDAYQRRLVDRINLLLENHDVSVTSSDVIREVGVFAERADISEECVRLRSHIDQFRRIMNAVDAAGKKLDFLVQEMFRETNTIGSKGNDAGIARHVVEIKTCIERMREMVQNIE